MKNLMWMVVGCALLAGLVAGCDNAGDTGAGDTPTTTATDAE